MATDITVGLDPFDLVIRVNFDAGGRRVQAEMDEGQAEEAAPEVANWLKIAASELRAQKAGEIDLRLGLGKMPKA